MPETSRGVPTKLSSICIAVIVTGANLSGAILIVVGYNTLFSKESWQLRELEQNQAKWESQHITHYQMSIDYLGYASESAHTPIRVEVDDGKVMSVVDSLGNKVPSDYCISYLCFD